MTTDPAPAAGPDPAGRIAPCDQLATAAPAGARVSPRREEGPP